VTIDAADLKGTMPALVRILAQPGSGQYLGRLIIFKRDEGTLANFANIYEAEDASVIYPSVAWTEVADGDRGDGAYMRCLPSADANGQAQGLRFTIANPGDHEGRFAVFGVGYDDAGAAGEWTHQAKVVVGNVIQEGASDWEAEALQSWGLIYAGEFELPAVPLSNSEGGYDAGPYIEWHSTRASGTSEFRLDGILLVYVGDSEKQPTALDVQCADVDSATNVSGVSTSEELLIENFPDKQGLIRELAHVVAQTDGDFKRALAVAARGDFMMLDPAADNLLVFVQTEVGLILLEDSFETYKGNRWIGDIADFETDETWTTLPAEQLEETTYIVEGSKGRRLTVVLTDAAGALRALDASLDLEIEGRFTNDDYVVAAIYIDDKTDMSHVRVNFRTSSGNGYYAQWLPADTVVGWNFLIKKKSDCVQYGSGDWANINDIHIYIDSTSSASGFRARYDYVRIEKADPDNAAVPNATGSQWDFQPNAGIWTITEDISGAGATLACLDVESGVVNGARIDETTPGDVRFRARVMAKRDAGYVGIVWRAEGGVEDTYTALLDVTNDKLLVREYSNGSPAQLDNPDFTSAVDTWYVVGVVAKGDTFRVYATAASNLDDDDDVFNGGYLLSTVEDATLTTGKCGVMSISTLGRFDEVKLSSLQDKMIPADEITLEGKAIWRTIAPFGE